MPFTLMIIDSSGNNGLQTQILGVRESEKVFIYLLLNTENDSKDCEQWE